jgi:hypothetical protein
MFFPLKTVKLPTIFVKQCKLMKNTRNFMGVSVYPLSQAASVKGGGQIAPPLCSTPHKFLGRSRWKI